MVKPSRDDLVSIEAHVSYRRDRAMVRVARQWYSSNNTKHPGKVRVWIVNFDVPLLDDDLIKVLASAVLYAGDPNKRHLKPPRARFWREAGMEIPVPPGGGEGGEDTPPEPEMDPLPGLVTNQGDGSTIMTGPAPLKAAPPKAARSSAREPRVRNLRTRKTETVDGA